MVGWKGGDVRVSRARWFDGGGNGKICGKGMNAARQN